MGRLVLAVVAAICLPAAALAEVRVREISSPAVWVDALFDRIADNPMETMVEINIGLGTTEYQARSAIAGFESFLTDGQMQDYHPISYEAHGEGVRHFLAASYWSSGVPLYFSFVFLKTGETWILAEWRANTRLANLSPLPGKTELLPLP
ncbi:hypothetical protein [Maricaulis sp. CAU 1757]